MNHGAFQRRGEIRRRFRRFSVIPGRKFFRAGRAQHSIEVVLPGAALKVDQLRHAEAAQNLALPWRNRLQQGEQFRERPGKINAVLNGAGNEREPSSWLGLRSVIDLHVNPNLIAELLYFALRIFVQLERLPDPRQPLLAFGYAQVLKTLARYGAGEDQTILGAGGGHVKEAHAFELFAPTGPFLQLIKKGAAHHLTAPVGHPQAQTLASIENKGRVAPNRFAMQVGNDHHRELESLRLMNGHQPHHVRRLVHLAFAFAAADGFELFNIVNEVADQVSAGSFKLFSQAEEFFHVRNAMRAVKVSRDHRHEFRLRNRLTQELGDAAAISAPHHRLKKRRRSIELRALFSVDELDLALTAQRWP